MNWVDAVILAMFVWFTYAAFNAGLIREIITILGAVFAVVLAGLFYTDLAQDVDVAIKDIETSEVVAFGVIFGATILASQLLALFLRQAANLLFLGIFDSIGGALFGMAKAFVFVEMGLMAAITFETLGLREAVRASELAPFFLDVLPLLTGILPDRFENAVEAF